MEKISSHSGSCVRNAILSNSNQTRLSNKEFTVHTTPLDKLYTLAGTHCTMSGANVILGDSFTQETRSGVFLCTIFSLTHAHARVYTVQDSAPLLLLCVIRNEKCAAANYRKLFTFFVARVVSTIAYYYDLLDTDFQCFFFFFFDFPLQSLYFYQASTLDI